MQNPYTPPQNASHSLGSSFHTELTAFILFCMFGGIFCILTALASRNLFHLKPLWPSITVLWVFILFGCYHFFRAKSSAKSSIKLMIGTFLIWIPYPIHFGVAACAVSTEMMPIREFTYGTLPPPLWWTVTSLAITIGTLATIAYLRYSRRRQETTIGVSFVAISWAGQGLLLALASTLL